MASGSIAAEPRSEPRVGAQRPFPQSRTPLPRQEAPISASHARRSGPEDAAPVDHDALREYVALIIAYRDPELVAEVLEQLAAQTQAPRLALIVDNGGTLEPADLEGWPLADRARLISRPDNPGYGAAVNEAQAHLDDSALLVLTHDAVFGPELAERLLSALKSRADAGAAGPILHFASDPDRVFSAGGRLSPSGVAAPVLRALSADPYPVDWLEGAIVMHSPRALRAIGWLAEDYFLYFEDVDTGWRLARAGWRSIVEPSAIAYQEPGGHPTYLGMRNMALFSRKAGISAPRSLLAAARRGFRVIVGRLRRGRSPEVLEVWRGWRDGRAGISGRPTR